MLLFKKIEIVHPLIVNLCPELIELHEVVDASVYSTLRLATTCGIPWLCIDNNMAQIVNCLGWPVVKNCLFIMTNASSKTQLADRKYGLFRHAYEQLPFPLRYQDLLDLSCESDINSTELLTKLLRQNPNAFKDAEHAATAITDLFLPVLADAWIKKKFKGLKSVNDVKFPKYVTKLANSCFYLATQSGGNYKTEYKFALLFHTMTMRLVTKLRAQQSQQLVDIISELATNFLFGHLMSIEAVNQNLNDLLELPTNKTSS